MKTNIYTRFFFLAPSWRWYFKVGTAILTCLLLSGIGIAQITTYPHTEGFENGGSIPSGWSNDYVSDVIDWTFVSANQNASITPRTGSYMAEFRFDDYGPITMLVSPQFDLTGLTAPYLSFWYANVNWAGDIDAMQAYYSPDGGTTWTALGANITAEHTAWTEFATTLPSPSANYLIGFEAESFWARGFNIDDVWVGEAPSCLAPSSLTATGGLDSATLSWTENGTATEWEIEYGEVPYTPTGVANVLGVTSNPYELPALSAETDYVYYVRAICGIGDESDWVGPFAFSTVPSAPAPYATNFANVPTGWTVDITLDDAWYAGQPTGFINEEVAFTNLYSFVNNAALYSINIGTLPAGSELTFDYVFSDYGEEEDFGTSGEGTLTISITDDFGATYTVLEEIAVENAAAGWNPASYDLSAYDGEYVSIQFRGDWVSGDYNMAIDNFYVGLPPSCFAPTDLTSEITSDTEATLSWTAPEDGTPTDYEYVFSTSNSVPGGSGTSTSGATSVDLTSLTNGETYYLYVRSNCDGDGFSTWEGPLTVIIEFVENDLCSNAITVACDGGPYIGSTEFATNENLALCSFDVEDNEQFSPGVWYVFEGTGDVVTASLCDSDYDTRINIFTGSCGSLSCIGGSDDFCAAQSEVAFPTTLGVDYYILVHGYSAFSFGDYSLDVTCEAPCSPVTTNDDCADAVSVTVQPSSGGTYTSANDECAFPSLMGNNDCGGGYSTLYDIFYTFNSGSNTGLYLETSVAGVSAPVASGDYFVALYEGTDCDAVYWGCGGFTMGGEIYIDGLDVNTDYLVRLYTSSSGIATRGNYDFMIKQIAIPDNDECSGATPLTLQVEVEATTIGASESLPAGTCGGDADDDVWFSFVAPSFNVDIIVDVPDFFLDPVIEVRSGACNGTAVDCSDDYAWFDGTEELLDQDLIEGQTYYVRVYGVDEGLKGNFSIRYQPSYIPPPANDNAAPNTPVMNNALYVYPNCLNVAGTTTGATSDGIFGFLPDVWYQFNAISNGVAIRVNADFDCGIRLWEFDGVNTLTEVDYEDVIWFASGTEKLNFDGLTEGMTYYVQVEDWDEAGGDFSICVQKLRKPYCSYTNPLSLCSIFKSSATGANTTTFEFSGAGSMTSSAPINLSNPALGLLYNTNYDVNLTANYSLLDGDGFSEIIQVPGPQCNITLIEQPDLDVKSNQRCMNGATLYRSSYLQAVAQTPNLCGVTGYRVEFTPVDNCAGAGANPLETFSKTITSPSASMSLSYAFNHIPLAGNSSIGYWSVRWKPRFGVLEGEYGNAYVIAVNGTAPAGMLEEPGDDMNGLENAGNAVAANLYPNPNNGDMVNLNMTGITSDNVFVRIMDGMGRVVYTNRYTVNGSLNTIVAFNKPLATGLYMVEFTTGNDVITQRMMVTK